MDCLIATIYHVQTPKDIMDFLWKFSTYLVLIPLGCMKLVQTSDLFIKLFKDVVNKLATGNMQEHLQDNLTDKITAD